MAILNIASVLLGIIALILPVINLLSTHKHKLKKNILMLVSLSACSIAICFQLFYQNHLVRIQDWSALMDVSGSTVLISAILVGLTVTLNVSSIFGVREL
ncbi:hypothetical protein [Oceanobacillus sp. 1P07AA]|uniref:hypothetical protein n=1 Tax=Oceanobacillus sp. 1P07AA TaxID=3132293 RepID=UPI0039A4F619